MGVKKMKNVNVSSELISLLFVSVYGAASSIQNCISPLVLRLKKYKNGNSARRTYLQRQIRSPITQNGCDNFISGISGKLLKIATANVIFSRTADRFAANFALQLKRSSSMTYIKTVHSTSTLKELEGFILFRH